MAKAKRPKRAEGEFFKKWGNVLLDPEEVANNTIIHPTGSIRLDKLLGGGLPGGMISELKGPKYSGKTALALSTARRVLERDNDSRVLWIDLERALDIRKKGDQTWLLKNGIDVLGKHRNRFVIVRDIIGEEMYRMIIDAVQQGLFQYIVLDSMGVVVTQAELDGEIGESHFGGVARLNSQSLKLLFHCFGENQETHISILNQIRAKIGSPIPGATQGTGGKALEHAPGISIVMRKIGQVVKPDYVASKIRVTFDKNRRGEARAVDLLIDSRFGLDVRQEFLEDAVTAGLIHKTGGGWYWLYDRPQEEFAALTDEERQDPAFGFVKRARGEDAMKAFLEEEGWMERLYDQVVNSASVLEVDDAEED